MKFRSYGRQVLATVLALLIVTSAAITVAPVAEAAGPSGSVVRVADGNYKIHAKLNYGFCVDVLGGFTAPETNVMLYHDNDESNAQNYTITHVKDGWYKIQNMSSLLVLDVANGSKASGTNVWQHIWNGTDAQLWQFIDAGDGSYYLKNKLGCYLDIDYGRAADYTNIQVYAFNGGDNQKFTLSETRFADGNYKIHSFIDSNYCVDVYGASTEPEANVMLYHDNDESNAQVYSITHVRDGWYKIQNMGSLMVLDVANGSKASGANVWQHIWNGTDAQLWQIINSGDSYYLKNKLGCYLDIDYGRATDGTNIQVYDFNGGANQKFTFEPSRLVDGNYKIRSLLDTNFCIDVYAASTEPEANVMLYHDNNESNAQNFTLTHVQNGWYKIQNMGSGLVLDVANGSTSSGANVWQHIWNGTDAQLWQIINGGNGYYLKNKLGYYLDVYDGKAADSTNIWVIDFNGSDAQKFIFTPAQEVVSPEPQPEPEPSTWTGYVKTSNPSNPLRLRAEANTSSATLAQLSYGTAVTILSETGDWYYVEVNGQNGYVAKAYITSENPYHIGNATPEEAAVAERLNAMMAGSYGNGVYKLNTTYAGPYYTEECKGFAKQVHKILFGYNIGTTNSKPNNHTIGITSNTSAVGSLSSLNEGNVKDLMLKGRAGDFIQVRRSHGGSHSMIFLSANNDGVTVYECNVGGNRNGIQKKTYSWSEFVAQNSKATLYTANNYWLH